MHKNKSSSISTSLKKESTSAKKSLPHSIRSIELQLGGSPSSEISPLLLRSKLESRSKSTGSKADLHIVGKTQKHKVKRVFLGKSTQQASDSSDTDEEYMLLGESTRSSRSYQLALANNNNQDLERNHKQQLQRIDADDESENDGHSKKPKRFWKEWKFLLIVSFVVSVLIVSLVLLIFSMRSLDLNIVKLGNVFTGKDLYKVQMDLEGLNENIRPLKLDSNSITVDISLYGQKMSKLRNSNMHEEVLIGRVEKLHLKDINDTSVESMSLKTFSLMFHRGLTKYSLNLFLHNPNKASHEIINGLDEYKLKTVGEIKYKVLFAQYEFKICAEQIIEAHTIPDFVRTANFILFANNTRDGIGAISYC